MLIAFDLDDTLFKEMDYVASGYRAVAQALERRLSIDAHSLENFLMAHRPKGFEKAIERFGLKGVTVDELDEIYRYHMPEISLVPGAKETLESLRRQGHALALITDGKSRRQRLKIEALGIECLFDTILVSEETGGNKLTDVPWDIIDAKYPGMRKAYVGDNINKDFYLPNLRGWTTVMLRDAAKVNVFEQNPLTHKAEYRPQITIDDIATLLRLQNLPV